MLKIKLTLRIYTINYNLNDMFGVKFILCVVSPRCTSLNHLLCCLIACVYGSAFTSHILDGPNELSNINRAQLKGNNSYDKHLAEIFMIMWHWGGGMGRAKATR